MVEKATSLAEVDSEESSGRSVSGAASESGVQANTISGIRPRVVQPLESGVFSGSSLAQASQSALTESLQAALRAASEGDTGLGALQRSLQDSSRALTASRHAQQALSEQLRSLHTGLSALLSEKAALERYAGLLVQERDAALDAAEKARREAKREREFLVAEQDRFIQLLLEEHEAELGQAREAAERATALIPPVDQRPTLPPRRSAAEQDGPEVVQVPPSEPGPLVDLESEAKTLPPGPRVDDRPLPSFADEEEDEPARASDASDIPPATVARIHLAPAPGAAPSENSERAPAVLDLEVLEAEVEGNSERPPPIRRMDDPMLRMHLAPARVPTQLMDTLGSAGDDDPRDDPA